MNNVKFFTAARALAIGMVAALVLVGTAGAETILIDDFEGDISKWSVSSPITPQISSKVAHSGKSSLEIKGYPNPDIKARYTFPQSAQGKLTVWFYDPKGEWLSADMILLFMDATYNKKAVGFQIMDDDQYYKLYQRGGFVEVMSNAPRYKGWHKFEFDVSDEGTKFIIDDKVQPYIANDEKRIYAIDFNSGWNKNSIAYWDDISFTSPNPTPIVPTPTPMQPLQNTPTVTPTPTPTSTPSASVQLHGEKTDVLIGEDIIFKLSAVNKITKPVMSVQVILIPPSGMSVTSSEFATSGAGQYTTTYKLDPGAGKDIEVRIKTNQQGDFNVKGEIVYYYGDNKSTAEEHTLNLPIKVREISKIPTPAPQSPTLSFWVSLLIFGISYRLIKRDFNR